MKRRLKIFIIVFIFIVVALIGLYIYMRLNMNMAEVAMFGNWDKVERMINNDADVNAKIRSNYAYIYTITNINDYLGLKDTMNNNNTFENVIFLRYISPINASVMSELSVLMMACADGKKEIVELLIDNEADVNEESIHHGTPITLAVKSVNIEIAQILIDNGADINTDAGLGSFTPLTYASMFGDYEMAKFLIENGADVDMGQGNAPIVYAMFYDHFCIAKLIYSNISEFKYSNEERLIMSSYIGDFDEVRELVLDRKTDPNIRIRGFTPLSAALKSENLEIIDFLIDEGADPNAIVKLPNMSLNDLEKGISAKDYAKEKGIELD